MVHAAWDSEEEARAIGEEIEQAQIKGRALNDMAILVRASFQMREFEERFVTLGLNYRVIGGPRFYERQEIRDAMAFFRVVSQPADDLAFERIVNVPKRGLGEAAVRQVHDVARARGIPMLAAARELVLTDEMKPKPRKSLTDVVEMFTRWQGMLETTPGHELAETILEESGYTEMWQNDRSADAPTRLENLKELVETISGFESMRAFLEHVALVMDTDNNPDLDAVSIMTLHSAKGLEFETVFLPGWEEGLFPHQRALDEGGRSGLEEERRLAYVGLTRAKRHCHIWFVSNRRIHGLWQSTLPSRFLDELPEAHVEVAEMDTGYGGYGRGGRFGASGGIQAAPMAPRASTRPNLSPVTTTRPAGNAPRPTRPTPPATTGAPAPATRSNALLTANPARAAPPSKANSSPSPPARPPPSPVGDRVFHLKFGNGNIASIDGNKLTIDFDKAGQKRVLDGFVERVG
jgi:DNA helicase-2/ATP-dependent DNA helicase PcrA